MRIGYKSHVGMVREHNEDTLLVMNEYDPMFCVFAVADGMGGHNAGEVASKIAIEELKDFFIRNHQNNEIIKKDEYIKELIEKINSTIFNKGQENPDLSGMGTTLTLTVLFQDQLHISHIGDSRIYRINNRGIVQLTEDHSLVATLIKDGKITKEEARNHPQKNIITRALGTEKEINLDMHQYIIDSEDTILLCTDGLTNLVTESEIENIIKENTDFQKAADLLVQLANDKGGSDNITLIIFQC